MAKNFASVLASLRAASQDKVQEIDRTYTANCDWLLEQFKLTQASLLALRTDAAAPIQDIAEQQSTAKTRGRKKQGHKQAAAAAAAASQQEVDEPPAEDAEKQPQLAISATPAPAARVTRSRRGQAAASNNAADTGSQQIPSPPKTRARGKRNQTASKPFTVPSASRSITRSAAIHTSSPSDSAVADNDVQQEQQQHVENASTVDAARQQAAASPGSSVHNIKQLRSAAEATNTACSPDSNTAQREQTPTADRMDQAETQASPAQGLEPPKANGSPQAGPVHESDESMRKSGKRKHSTADASTDSKQSKRRHVSSAGQDQDRHQRADRLSGDVHQSILKQLEPEQLVEDTTLADSPSAQQQIPESLLEQAPTATEVSSASDARPTCNANPALGVVTDAEQSIELGARDSDFQDAQDRLSTLDPPELQPSSTSQLAPQLAVSSTPDSDAVAAADLVEGLQVAEAETDTAATVGFPGNSATLNSQADPSNDGQEAAAAAANDSPVHEGEADKDDDNGEEGLQDDDQEIEPAAPSALGVAAAVPLPRTSAVHGLVDSSSQAAAASDAAAASSGMAGNLVSAIRSFLPGGKPPEPQLAGGKKPVKVKALEAAEAARRKEAARNADRLKQKGTLDKQRAERAKAKQEEEQQRAQEEAKKRQEAIRKRDEDAAQRRRAKEETERKARQERQVKAEASQAKKKVEEAKKKEPERQGHRPVELQAHTRPPLQPQSSNVPGSGAAAAASSKPTLPPLSPTTLKQPTQASGHADSFPGFKVTASSQAPGPSTHAASAAVLAPPALQTKAAPPMVQRPVESQPRQLAQPADAPAETYQMSPYRGSDSDEDSSEDEEPKKPIPEWARGRALMQQLASQVQTDPDEVFQQHRKTCSLDEVFGHSEADRNGKKKDLSRRTSSGNWIEDRVTWKEELNYKKAMGYV